MTQKAKPVLLAEGMAFPEGPAFDRDGNLFVVNMADGRIVKITPDGQVSEFVNTGGAPNGAAFDAKGHLFIADARLGSLLEITPDGTVTTFADRCGDVAFRSPNDLVFDPHGNIYFTDPGGSSKENPIGRLYRVTPEGEVELFAEGYAFPNGLALTDDRSALILAESLTHRLLRFELKPDGRAGEVDLFCQLEGGVGPDGIALDVEGNVYVAMFGTGRIDVVSPAGELLGALDAGGQNPTNVAFGGPDRKTLVVTETEHNAVFQLAVDLPGQPLFGPCWTGHC